MSLEPQWEEGRLARRRAVEALRSGVPNADAVIALGSGQNEIEDRFTELLENVSGPPNGSGGRSGRDSMLLGAGLGQGKSHLLTHLGHLATSAGFVVSTVVISKETPLYDPAKVLRAATRCCSGAGPTPSWRAGLTVTLVTPPAAENPLSRLPRSLTTSKQQFCPARTTASFCPND